MLKGDTIYLRMLNAEDWEKTYLWHNDNALQKLTCGPVFEVSKEIEKKWVLEKASHNREEIYFAIYSLENDEMIGFSCLTNINLLYRSCYFGGIVIGNNEYRNGTEYLQICLLMLDYAFCQLNINRLTVSCLKEHILARSQIPALYFIQEGIGREAVVKNGRKYDEYYYALLADEYMRHKKANDYDTEKLIIRMIQISKDIKCELKK